MLVVAGGGMVMCDVPNLNLRQEVICCFPRALLASVGRSLFMLPFWEDEFLVLIPTLA